MLETLTLSVTMLEDTLRRLHDSGAGYKYSDLLTYYSTQNVEHERTWQQTMLSCTSLFKVSTLCTQTHLVFLWLFKPHHTSIIRLDYAAKFTIRFKTQLYVFYFRNLDTETEKRQCIEKWNNLYHCCCFVLVASIDCYWKHCTYIHTIKLIHHTRIVGRRQVTVRFVN